MVLSFYAEQSILMYYHIMGMLLALCVLLHLLAVHLYSVTLLTTMHSNKLIIRAIMKGLIHFLYVD